MILTGSTVSDNTAAAAFQATSGGGIFNAGSSTLILQGSTVSGNWATVGGGIHNFFGGTVRLINSTVSGNSAFVGGGIYTEVGSIDLAGETNIVLNTIGGGIYSNDGIFTTSDWTGHVSDNTPDNCEPPMTLGAILCD
jgi:hypothetical protein